MKPKRPNHLHLVTDRHEGESYESILRRMKMYRLRMMLQRVDSEAEKRLIRVEIRRRGQEP